MKETAINTGVPVVVNGNGHHFARDTAISMEPIVKQRLDELAGVLSQKSNLSPTAKRNFIISALAGFLCAAASSYAYFPAGKQGGDCITRDHGYGYANGVGSMLTNLQINQAVWFAMLSTTKLGKEWNQKGKSYSPLAWGLASVCALGPLAFYVTTDYEAGTPIVMDGILNFFSLPQTAYALLGVKDLSSDLFRALRRYFFPRETVPPLLQQARNIFSRRFATFENNIAKLVREEGAPNAVTKIQEAFSSTSVGQQLEFLEGYTRTTQPFPLSAKIALASIPAFLILVSRVAFVGAGYVDPSFALRDQPGALRSSLSWLSAIINGLAAIGFSWAAFRRLDKVPGEFTTSGLITTLLPSLPLSCLLLLGACDFFAGGPAATAMLQVLTGVHENGMDEYCGHSHKPSQEQVFFMWCASVGSSLFVNAIVRYFVQKSELEAYKKVTNTEVAELFRDVVSVEAFSQALQVLSTDELSTVLADAELGTVFIKMLKEGGVSSAAIEGMKAGRFERAQFAANETTPLFAGGADEDEGHFTFSEATAPAASGGASSWCASFARRVTEGYDNLKACFPGQYYKL